MWWDKPKPNQPPAKERQPLPFMKWRVFGYLVSVLIVVVTTISLATQGLNMGLDFTGGIQIEATREAGFDPGSFDAVFMISALTGSGPAAYAGRMSVEVRAAVDFDDVAAVLGPKRPDANVCWCLSHRLDGKTQREDGPAAAARARRFCATAH